MLSSIEENVYQSNEVITLLCFHLAMSNTLSILKCDFVTYDLNNFVHISFHIKFCISELFILDRDSQNVLKV